MNQEDIENLALLLLYKTSWDENKNVKLGEEPILSSWKNIRFEVLDSLNNKGLIINSKNRKPVTFTSEGIQKAKELEKTLFGTEREME